MPNIDNDQSFSRKTDQLDLDISTNLLPSSLTQGTLVANILNVRPGLTPAIGPSANFTLGGSELAGWTVLIGVTPPTVPCTLRLRAGGQRRNFPLYLASGATPAPSFSVQPSISGTVQVGQTLTGVDGTISNGTVASRQWFRDAGAISGATGATYTPVTGDIGGFITFRVTATGAGGTTSATSSSVGPVIAAADPGVGAPTAQPGVTSTLSVPDLTRTSSVLVTPPTFQGNFDITYHQYDWVHLEMADDYAFSTHTGNFYAQLPAVGDPTFTLGGYVPAASGFARIRGLKAGVLVQSVSAEDWTAYSTPVAWGDATAPTITSSAAPTVAENAVLSHTLTANEPIATWSLVGGADISQFEISGTTLRWLANGTKDYETPADAGADNTYAVTVRATDYAGNATDQSIVVTVSDVVEVVPATWSTSNKSIYGTLSGGNLVWSYDGGVGTYSPVGVMTNNTYSSGKIEIKLGINFNGATGYVAPINLGVGVSSTNMNVYPSPCPGKAANTGLCIVLSPHGDMNIYQNGAYMADVPGTAATGMDFRMLIDFTLNKLWFKINGSVTSGDPVAGTGGIDISGWRSGSLRVYAVPEDNYSVTLTPTPTGLSTGYSGL